MAKDTNTEQPETAVESKPSPSPSEWDWEEPWRSRFISEVRDSLGRGMSEKDARLRAQTLVADWQANHEAFEQGMRTASIPEYAWNSNLDSIMRRWSLRDELVFWAKEFLRRFEEGKREGVVFANMLRDDNFTGQILVALASAIAATVVRGGHTARCANTYELVRCAAGLDESPEIYTSDLLAVNVAIPADPLTDALVAEKLVSVLAARRERDKTATVLIYQGSADAVQHWFGERAWTDLQLLKVVERKVSANV